MGEEPGQSPRSIVHVGVIASRKGRRSHAESVSGPAGPAPAPDRGHMCRFDVIVADVKGRLHAVQIEAAGACSPLCRSRTRSSRGDEFVAA